MRICLPGSASQFERAERERYLFAQKQDYVWVHAPGQPPFCKSVPSGEQFTKTKEHLTAIDLVESAADIALAMTIRLFKHNDTIASFKRYYPIRPIPAVADRWTHDEEFARQRLDGPNPFLIKLAKEIPENFPVSDETVRGVIPEGTTLAQLLAEHRLFLLDYEILHGLKPLLGRFCVAPICLFWKNDLGRLMPLAIQLGQSPAEAETIFTPKDEHWTWLMARAYVQSADGTYHEVVAHLTRTHLAMEPFWVAACRTLPPQHPLHVLLKPHFTGTLEVNYGARNRLIAPGGPIDESIAIGSEGALTLVGLAYDRWTFENGDPIKDMERRGVLSDDVLPHYHYRDDALALFNAIKQYVYDLLRLYYESDKAVRKDTEVQAWAHELVRKKGGRIKGLPVSKGAIATFDQLYAIVAQVIYCCSVRHAAVNNGQYAQYGWIPNIPGALCLPPPKDHSPRSEANFVYALPDARAVGYQLAAAHVLSRRTLTPLGTYPDAFFHGVMPARNAIDRFRGKLDDIGRSIKKRNETLDVPYVNLEPWTVGRSIVV